MERKHEGFCGAFVCSLKVYKEDDDDGYHTARNISMNIVLLAEGSKTQKKANWQVLIWWLGVEVMKCICHARIANLRLFQSRPLAFKLADPISNSCVVA